MIIEGNCDPELLSELKRLNDTLARIEDIWKVLAYDMHVDSRKLWYEEHCAKCIRESYDHED
jgi:hypothetical protein